MRWARLRRASFPAGLSRRSFSRRVLPLIACARARGGHDGLAGAADRRGVRGALVRRRDARLRAPAGWPLSLADPLFAATRDLLLPVLWIKGWLGSDFVWRGNAMSSVVSTAPPATVASAPGLTVIRSAARHAGWPRRRCRAAPCKGESMKLVRYGAGRPRKARHHRRRWPHPRPVEGRPDIAGEALTPNGLAKIRKAKIDTLPLVRGNPRLGPCVGKVGNFIAIGLNYADHAAEAGMPIPKEPIIFNKAPTCICGPNDDTIIPKESTKLDYEVELGIVIGSRARYLAKDKAMDAVAGYFLANDVSERVFQIERSAASGTRARAARPSARSGRGSSPRTRSRIRRTSTCGSPSTARARQKGSTRTMVFGVEHLVWYCSQFFVMEPGDIIVTGTPPGVALGMKPPQFLKAGDVVQLGIAGLGEQQQKVVALKR